MVTMIVNPVYVVLKRFVAVAPLKAINCYHSHAVTVFKFPTGHRFNAVPCMFPELHTVPNLKWFFRSTVKYDIKEVRESLFA